MSDSMDDLPRDDLIEELLLCARYGELEELKSLITKWNDAHTEDAIAVDVQGEDGLTLAHMAASNGHSDILSWVLENDASVAAVRNDSKNSPLDWALLNNQCDCVKLLLRLGSGIDVLEQSGLGKTPLAHAFETMNADILKAMLEHPSAARLNKDGSIAPAGEKSDLEKEEESASAKEGNIDEVATACSSAPQTMISQVKFGNYPTISVQEIGFAQEELGPGDSDLQLTGGYLWAASIVLSRWITDIREEFDGKRVVELGAGCCLPSLTAAYCTNAAHVVATELDCATYGNTMENVNRHSENDTIIAKLSVAPLNWLDRDSWPSFIIGNTDVIIGCDLVYDINLVEPLIDTIVSLLPDAGEGVFYYVTADTDRDGCAEFLKKLEETGFAKEEFNPPQEYFTNPFVSEASSEEQDKLFAIRFPEFSSMTFTLYRFTMSR